MSNRFSTQNYDDFIDRCMEYMEDQLGEDSQMSDEDAEDICHQQWLSR